MKCKLVLAALALSWGLTACGATTQQMGTVAPTTSKPPSITTETASAEESAAPEKEQPEANTNQTAGDKTTPDVQSKPEEETTAPIMTGYLAQQEALEIAYDHAGVSGDQVAELSCQLEEDENPVIYEIEFVAGRYEYEFEINAETGDILDYDQSED